MLLTLVCFFMSVLVLPNSCIQFFNVLKIRSSSHNWSVHMSNWGQERMGILRISRKNPRFKLENVTATSNPHFLLSRSLSLFLLSPLSFSMASFPEDRMIFNGLLFLPPSILRKNPYTSAYYKNYTQCCVICCIWNNIN